MTDRLEIIPTGPGMGRGLVWHDDQSKNYRAVALIDDAADTLPRTKAWRRGWAYDQHETSQCVAYTGKGMLNTLKLSRQVPYLTRRWLDPAKIYEGAQLNDQWPGQDYAGTSALGLCRYLQSVGLITEYRWCFGIDDVLLALSWVGPVGIGIQWRDGMWTPDPDGYIWATGAPAGGHEVELTAVDVEHERVVVTNSWGIGWGRSGRAFIDFADLDRLLTDQGDAFVLVA